MIVVNGEDQREIMRLLKFQNQPCILTQMHLKFDFKRALHFSTLAITLFNSSTILF